MTNGPIFEITKKTYVLKYDFSYKGIVVPEGFPFNGNSIPKAFSFIFGHPYDPKTVRAALVHDYLYFIQHDRREADRIYLEALSESGVMWRRVFYCAVRVFGGLKYR